MHSAATASDPASQHLSATVQTHNAATIMHHYPLLLDVCLCPCLPLSQVVHVSCLVQGAAVAASDISSSMANEAKRRYEEAVSSGQQAPSTAPTFSATDLESITGSFHTVVCLDVMIHYPQASHVSTHTGLLPFCCLC